jgi:uncharacterized protein YndB with AHSA1/START domain
MITVNTTIEASIEKVWDAWTNPTHITQWCQASDDWHAPYADNDVRVDGTFKTTMAAKDGSFSFDLEGVYTKVELHKFIAYTLPDGRNVEITFKNENGSVNIIESFDPESQNSHELQQQGWQMILNNFKKHVESIKS